MYLDWDPYCVLGRGSGVGSSPRFGGPLEDTSRSPVDTSSSDRSDSDNEREINPFPGVIKMHNFCN